MLGNDDLTYQKKTTYAQQFKSSVQALITIERAQKLDLLIHLINNLTQSLVVCGPVGIGKSKLLQTLAENNHNDWPLCILSATSEELSFEKIQIQLLRFLSQSGTNYATYDLSAILAEYDQDNKKVVLIIDDAGVLVPGLITMLIEYANANHCLRLVLVMTHDDLHIKNSSDAIIDECHFIELPPLNKKQCMTFLQNLSAQPDAPISFNAVTDILVDNLYSVTHGIPGKIVNELPRLSEYRTTLRVKSNTMMQAVIVLLIVVAAFYLYEPEPETNSSMPGPLLNKKVAEVQILEPVVGGDFPKSEFIVKEKPVYSEIVDAPTIVPSVENERPSAPADKSVDQKASNSLETEEVLNIAIAEEIPIKDEVADKSTETVKVAKDGKTDDKKAQVEQKKESLDANLLSAKPQVDDVKWIKSQHSQYYTMQLMVLSQQQAAIDFLKKNSRLGSNLRSLKLPAKNGRQKFVLLYGAFSSSSDAEKAKKNLPPQLRNAWIRKIKDLQQLAATQ